VIANLDIQVKIIYNNPGLDCLYPVCYGVPDNNLLTCKFYIIFKGSAQGRCRKPNTCDCSPGYYDKNCNVTVCNGIFSNDTLVCNGQGNCTSKENCKCNPNYKGNYCEISSCFGVFADSNKVCSGNGKCNKMDECKNN
jgi:hypothetical protein